MAIDMSWLWGLFGNRRLIGCKECDLSMFTSSTQPVDPQRLMWDKRLDYWNYNVQSQIAEVGMIGVASTWGRPMDAASQLPAPVYFYPTPYNSMSDGTHVSRPLRVGAVARGIAGDIVGDVRSMWLKRS